MKSKITKIQILKKGMAILLVMMFLITPATPIVYATDVGNTVTGDTESESTDSVDNTISGETGSESTETEGDTTTEGTERDIYNEYLLTYGTTGASILDIMYKLNSGVTQIEVTEEYQLRAIAELVNGTYKTGEIKAVFDEDKFNSKIEYNFEGITIKVISDIKIGNEEWTPIGTTSKQFKGDFIGEYAEEAKKGDKVVISGLSYKRENKGATKLNNIGLFGVVGESGTIDNIQVTNFDIDMPYTSKDINAKDNAEIANIVTTSYNAGNIAGINYGKIKNCINASNIIGISCVGGIVGRNENKGTIENCQNSGFIQGYDFIGGIAGYNTGTIKNSGNVSIGSVKADNNAAGGIAGISTNGIIIYAINKGLVEGTKYVGGIVGINKDASITTSIEGTGDKTETDKIEVSTNESTITGKESVGGIVGYSYNGKISKAINRGKIDKKEGGGTNLGGIVGESIETTITTVGNEGTIVGAKNVGGIVGSSKLGEISQVYNKAAITSAAENVGGIVGISDGSSIKEATNNGEIKGTTNIGGIVGTSSGNIENCLNASNITASNSAAGGIVGTSNGGEIKESINNQVTITSNENAGGIVGINNGATIKNCTAIGKVKATSKNAGGIVGTNNSGNVEQSKNSAQVIAKAAAGGIAGALNGGTLLLTHNEAYVGADGEEEGGIAGGSFSGSGAIKYSINEEWLGGDQYNDAFHKNTLIEGIIDINNRKDTIVEGCIYSNEKLELKSNANAFNIEAESIDYTTNSYAVRGDITPSKFNGSKPVFSSSDEKIYSIKDISYNGKQVYICITEDGVDKVAFNNEAFTIGCKSENKGCTAFEGLTLNYPEFEYDPEIYDYETDYEILDKINDIFPIYKDIEGNDVKLDTKIKYIVYKIDENGESTPINRGTEIYLKTGDKIKIEAVIDKFLVDSSQEDTGISKELAPKLELGTKNEYLEMKILDINHTPDLFKTELFYEYEVTKSLEIENVRITGSEKISAVASKNVVAKGNSSSVVTELPLDIVIDTEGTEISSGIYVEEALATGRYTTGKEILFAIKTNETINLEDTVPPDLQVKFSESGIGLYNYLGEELGAGYAKYRPDKTQVNKDGSTTFVYSYIIQEGDEGYVSYNCRGGEIVDAAGNVTSFESAYMDKNVTGEEITDKDLNITYKLYKGDTEITEESPIADKVFKEGETLRVQVEFDKILYNCFGTINDNDVTKILEATKAPSLYLNGNNKLKADASNVELIDGETGTIIIYEYEVGKLIADNSIKQKLIVDEILIKNENNLIEMTEDRRIPYSSEKHDTYHSDNEYDYIDGDAIKTFKLGEDKLHIVPPTAEDDIPMEGSSEMYADTTSPTVIITTNKNDSTNSDKITYTFEFSEKVKNFVAEDITVNGGTKDVSSFTEVEEGLIYTIDIMPIIGSSTESTVQVILEYGVCTDLVARELLRQEKVITIDKEKPTYMGYTINVENAEGTEKANKIIVEAIFNETLSEDSIDTLIPSITFGGVIGKGELDSSVAGNRIRYVYTTIPADGGKAQLVLNGFVKDIAGNNSDNINEVIEQEITLEQTVIKPDADSNVTYSFIINEDAVRDFSKPSYVLRDDVITVVKTETSGIIEDIEALAITQTEYKYKLDKNINYTHMKSMTINESAEDEFNAVTFYADNSGEIDISIANIIFDTIAPTIDISYDVDIKNENDRYTVGKELIINVTTSEEIQQLDKVPEINVSFSESGLGKYNYQKDTTKGNAIYVETKNEKGINTLTYKYVIENGDEGRPIIEFVNNETIKDLAGNTTNLGTKVVEPDIELEDTWPTSEDGLNMSYTLYKNSVSEENKITEKTYFTKSDKLIVEINYDKVLYARVGTINTVNATSRLTDKYAPSLYLNGNEQLTNDTIESTSVLTEYDEQSGKTVITYTYNFDGISEETIALEKLVLKNDKNTITQSNGYFKDGQIIYADKWYPNYLEEHKDLYKFIDKDAIKVINLEDSLVVDPNASEESKIYADTTAPLVNITANVSDPTNADEIEYTFEFSEVVKDFTIEKIKVNGGDIVGELTEVIKGLKYTLKVRPLIPTGNQGTLQVIVEKGACKDLVAIENVRQEKNITIDKVKPVFESYTIREDNNQIIIEAIYNETITEAVIPSLIIGDTSARGKWEEIKYNDNKVTYVYNTDAADGGKVYAMLFGAAKDLAGNYSDELSEFIESDIILERTVVKPSDENVYYTFEKNDKTIQDFSKPTYFKAKDIITVTKYETVNVLDEEGNQVNNEDGTPKTQEVQTKYSYEVSDKLNLTHMKYMNLEEPSKEENVGKVTFSTENGIDITTANIYFDTIAPKVELSINPVGEKNQDNIYTEGTELLITATTDETVQSEEIPEINLSFSNSGAGKYIPNKDSVKGNLEYLETIETENGRKIWAYRYIVQNGDDGIAILEYAKEIDVTDLAGNTTTLKGYPKANSGDVKLSDNEISGTETKVSYELYKNGEQITDFTNNTYFANGDTIKVITKFDKALYSSWGSSNEVVSKDTAPNLTIDDKKFEVLSVNNTETTTDIAYIYTIDGDSEGLLEELNLSTNKSIYAQLKDEKGNISYKTISGTIGNVDISKCNLHIYNSTTSISGNEITIDTIVPTVKIKANVQNPTNADKILYTIEFSEIVKDFTIEDITLNKGKIESSDKFVEKVEGQVYELEVIPDVAEGNVDDVQVIIEKGVCTDRANKGNLKAENVIRVDRKSPIFIGLEAYAPTNSNIKLNEEIDSVQENYGPGAIVTIVATFDENVTADAKLVLQFSESGTAKGTVKTVENIGNKITYTYEITEGDKGTLSIKAFTGKVVDVVGNETVVTRRIIEGDTIVAKTIAPQLKELKVVSPEEGEYKADTTITIEAIYDEEIYILEDNREIKLLNTNIEVEAEDGTKTYVDNAPELKLRFGNGEERQATVSGYGTKEDGSIDRTKVVYTYTIVEERTEIEKVDNNGVEEEREVTLSGDNGELEITSYTNKENAEVCDIAGNKAALNINQTGNTVIADTIRPEVINIEAEVEEPIVSNTGIYYKDGNEVKITVEFAEEVNPAVEKPEILVGFSESKEIEPTSYSKCLYETSENVNNTTVEYTYTIQEGENGYLWVKVPENQFKDIAGNTNVKADASVNTNIFADTIDPYLATNTNTTTQWKIEYIESEGIATGIKATGIFNEEIFSMKNNAIVSIEEMPTIGLFLNGKLERTSKVYRHEVENGQTKIIYEEDITDIDTTGSISVNFIDGTVYDRAGNKMTIELTDGDITSPIFKDLKVLTENGFYKAGEVIEIVARFEEETRLTTVPTLVVRLGERTLTLHGEYDLENSENNDTIKVAKYSYEVEDGDNGALNIISLKGQASDGVRTSPEISKIYIDLTDNKVNDVNTNTYELLNSEEYPYANNNEEYENVIADTKDPFIAKVEAKVNGEVIATYTKEEGKDAIISTGRTNSNELEYVITFSEPIFANDLTKEGLLSNIDLYNATIKDLILEYNSITIKAVTLSEAVQSLIISENIVKDRAGNTNDFERFNLVSTDFTKPTIGFISEYNGGTYVIPTNIGKVEIRPNVKIDEEISKIEYKWNNEEYVEIENYSSASDIAVPTKAFTEAGTQVLNIRATDIAGNVSETSKTYEILNSYIEIATSTREYTNQDITATVVFGTGLTDNRKVTFKAEGSENIVELNAKGINKDGNTEYTIVENGTIYAEATDRVGNKVFTETTITNIDKVAPEVNIALNRADLVIGTGKDSATIKTDVELKDNNWVEDAKFAYLQEDININNITSEQKAKISNELAYEAKTTDAVSTKDKTPYYLYVIATDKAGNETIEKVGPFTVLDTNEREKEVEGIEGALGAKETVPAEIDISKLIAFKQDGRFIEISYNNFTETEEYMDIIKEKQITLTEERDGYIDYEYYSYVQVNKPTVITVVGKDACGNEVTATFEVKPETIKGPEFEVVGNPEDWTNQDVKLEVVEEEPLSALTVNGTDILSKDAKVRSNIVITQNGDYKFVATDVYGNTSEKTITVTKIDKDNPVITKAESSGKDITITSEDATSGVEEYAITDTTEVPVEWSKSNVIKVTNDGTFYAWAKDKAGNMIRGEEVVVVDTTAPTITFNYTLITVEAGMPLEATIMTDEEAKISYSWDEENWIESEDFLTSVKVSKEYKTTGVYKLYAKAVDKYGNESKVQVIEFTVVKPSEDIDVPEIIFEDLPTIQVDGVHYVKVAADMTIEDVSNKMNKEALYGVTPEYKGLTEEKDLKTGSEITLAGETKYIVVVNGDVNNDGKVTPIDVTYANSIRLNKVKVNTIQKLAADFDLDGIIKPIDITMINSYRLGKIKGI